MDQSNLVHFMTVPERLKSALMGRFAIHSRNSGSSIPTIATSISIGQQAQTSLRCKAQLLKKEIQGRTRSCISMSLSTALHQAQPSGKCPLTLPIPIVEPRHSQSLWLRVMAITPLTIAATLQQDDSPTILTQREPVSCSGKRTSRLSISQILRRT